MFFGIFILLWIFAIGTIFGSFLNVVVWRLPQGMSLSFPASYCPHCQHPIRWRHNIPLLGWWILRGKCYDCGKPISARYPWVEFLCGLGFLCPAWLFLLGGFAIPVYFYDVTVYMTLLAIGLIEMDGQRIPLKILVPVGLLTLVNIGLFLPYWNSLYLIPMLEWLVTFLAWLLFLLLGIRHTSNRSAWVGMMILLAFFPGGLPLMWLSTLILGVVYSLNLSEKWKRGILPWSLMLLPTCQLLYAYLLFSCR